MVTIQDIANESGVAISTVSRALADSPKISVKTKARIKKIARNMGYTPNFAARNLTQRESNTVMTKSVIWHVIKPKPICLLTQNCQRLPLIVLNTPDLVVRTSIQLMCYPVV